MRSRGTSRRVIFRWSKLLEQAISHRQAVGNIILTSHAYYDLRTVVGVFLPFNITVCIAEARYDTDSDP